ncbi:hypothetical protein ALON55S_05300 [Alishewanella longhuensis]
MPVINVISAAKLAEQLPKLACLVLIGSRAKAKRTRKAIGTLLTFLTIPTNLTDLG